MQDKQHITDKEELLVSYAKTEPKDANIDLRFFFMVALSMLTFLLIFLPNIYVKNQIYYISRDISKLYDEYSILLEENKELKRKIEKIQFKNQVIDNTLLGQENF